MRIRIINEKITYSLVEFGIALIASSFIAGLFTFFAPCTLPLVPAFLGVISGVSPEELKDPESAKHLRGKIVANAIFYVLGFSLVFILFGVAFSFLGQIYLVRIWLQRLGGILVIIFGLVLLGLFNVPFLSGEKQIRAPKLLQSVSKTNSFILGALFSLGWSPCVGPLLGGILLLASGLDTVLQGAFLLVVFSLGFAIPFLLTALLIGKAFSAFGRWSPALKVINIIIGMFLVGLGILLISDQFAPVSNQFRGWLLQFQFYEEYINRFL